MREVELEVGVIEKKIKEWVKNRQKVPEIHVDNCRKFK
jgi:hypothetical protein